MTDKLLRIERKCSFRTDCICLLKLHFIVQLNEFFPEGKRFLRSRFFCVYLRNHMLFALILKDFRGEFLFRWQFFPSELLMPSDFRI